MRGGKGERGMRGGEGQRDDTLKQAAHHQDRVHTPPSGSTA